MSDGCAFGLARGFLGRRRVAVMQVEIAPASSSSSMMHETQGEALTSRISGYGACVSLIASHSMASVSVAFINRAPIPADLSSGSYDIAVLLFVADRRCSNSNHSNLEDHPNHPNLEVDKNDDEIHRVFAAAAAPFLDAARIARVWVAAPQLPSHLVDVLLPPHLASLCTNPRSSPPSSSNELEASSPPDGEAPNHGNHHQYHQHFPVLPPAPWMASPPQRVHSTSSAPCPSPHTPASPPDSLQLDTHDRPNHSTPTKGTLYLVGTGPGAADLLTLRAHRLLTHRDSPRIHLVIADRLVSPALIAYIQSHIDSLSASKNTSVTTSLSKKPRLSPYRLLISNKFHGNAHIAQQQIETWTLDALNAGQTVVRLKGGDAFVFGRGGEEALHARSHGHNVIVIPGVSSAFAAPGVAGIPVTHRGVADSILISTGRREDGSIPSVPAFDPHRTCVFLMAVTVLPKLVAHLTRDAGFPLSVPAAAIARATLPDQIRVVGTVGSIVTDMARARITSHATIVVGHAVLALNHPDLPSPLPDFLFDPILLHHDTDTDFDDHSDSISATSSNTMAVFDTPSPVSPH